MARHRRNRVDANQKSIVEALTWAGATVARTSQVGDSFPDLVFGWKGRTVLAEVKATPVQMPLDPLDLLEPDQRIFRDTWQGGDVVLLTHWHDALLYLGGEALLTAYLDEFAPLSDGERPGALQSA